MEIHTVFKILLLKAFLINGNLLLPETTSMNPTEEDNVHISANIRQTWEPKLPFLPPGYNKFELPRWNNTVPVFVKVTLIIYDVKDVDTKNEVLLYPLSVVSFI